MKSVVTVRPMITRPEWTGPECGGASWGRWDVTGALTFGSRH